MVVRIGVPVVTATEATETAVMNYLGRFVTSVNPGDSAEKVKVGVGEPHGRGRARHAEAPPQSQNDR